MIDRTHSVTRKITINGSTILNKVEGIYMQNRKVAASIYLSSYS